MKITKKKNFFIGKSVNYSTSVTVTKLETVIIWLSFISVFAFFIYSMFTFENIFLMILCDFIAMGLLFGVFLFIIFRKEHRDERISNTEKR